MVSGTSQDGATLNATAGVWLGAPAPSYTYQWSRCSGNGNSCPPIPTATASTYKLTDADVAHELIVTVTASNSSYPGGVAASSESTAIVSSRPCRCRGISPGIWNDPGRLNTDCVHRYLERLPGSSYTYQWQRSWGSGGSYVNIVGATSSTYTLTSADVGGYSVRVVVTASNASYPGGSSATASSNETGTVEAIRPQTTAFRS